MEEQKYPQDEEQNEYRYISASWLDGIARGLTARNVARHPCRRTRGTGNASLIALSAR